MQVGVISDTHGLLRPEALAALRGVDRILHAGDIGAPDIVSQLAQIAPVTAIRGNVDRADWARSYPEEVAMDLNGWRVLMLHDRKRLGPERLEGVQIVVSGHSHAPKVERADGLLLLNPGSAGPRRFRLPVTVALLALGAGDPAARIVEIA